MVTRPTKKQEEKMDKENLKNEVKELRRIIMEASIQLAKVENMLKEEENPSRPTQEDLNLAEGIKITELGLSVRARQALYRAGIENLKELYERVQRDPNFKYMRNVGVNTANEIKGKLVNIKEIIEVIENKRKIIEISNGPIEDFFEERTAKYLKKLEIYTLKELYEYKRVWDFNSEVRKKVEAEFAKYC